MLNFGIFCRAVAEFIFLQMARSVPPSFEGIVYSAMSDSSVSPQVEEDQLL